MNIPEQICKNIENYWALVHNDQIKNLINEPQSDRGEIECHICYYKEEKKIAFYPCGHTGVCIRCANLFKMNKMCCGLCKSQIKDWMYIWD